METPKRKLLVNFSNNSGYKTAIFSEYDDRMCQINYRSYVYRGHAPEMYNEAKCIKELREKTNPFTSYDQLCISRKSSIIDENGYDFAILFYYDGRICGYMTVRGNDISEYRVLEQLDTIKWHAYPENEKK